MINQKGEIKMFLQKSLLNNIFNDFDYYFGDNTDSLTTYSYYDRYNSTYKDGVYTLKIEVPGYGKEDLTINVYDNYLLLTSNDKKINKKLSIPKTIDVETLTSTCEKGILSITGNSKKEVNKKLIPIL